MNPQDIEKTRLQLLNRSRALEEKRKAIGPEKHRIGRTIDIVMKLIALLFDFIGFAAEIIPIFGGLVAAVLDIVADLIFALFYVLLRIKPLTRSSKVRRTLIMRIACFCIELIPYFNALPAYSIAVWYTSSVIRKEDREYNKGIRKAMKDVQDEERALQMDIQNFQTYAAQAEVQEQSEAEERQEVEEENVNTIFDKGVISPVDGIPMNESSVYRSVAGHAAIQDIVNHGAVRNAAEAGVKSGSRWGKKVYWTKGTEGKNHLISGDTHVIEAPHDVAAQRRVKKEDIKAVYKRDAQGKIVNIWDKKA